MTGQFTITGVGQWQWAMGNGAMAAAAIATGLLCATSKYLRPAGGPAVSNPIRLSARLLE